MTTLLGHPLSSNSRKVAWLLRELGAPFEEKTVDLMKGEQHHADHVALNPSARVPVLIDGPVVLAESNAILLHLAQKHGKFLGESPADRARVLQWLFWAASDLQMQLQGPWFAKLMATFGQPPDEAAHARLPAAAPTPLAVLDRSLAGRKFFVGDTFTLADIALAWAVGLATDAGLDLARTPAVQAWWVGLQSRTSYAG